MLKDTDQVQLLRTKSVQIIQQIRHSPHSLPEDFLDEPSFENYPFPIETNVQIEEFINSGILRQPESQRVHEGLIANFQQVELDGLIKWGFIYLVLRKYHQEEHKTRKQVQRLLNESYVKFFTNIRPPKEEIVNTILFSCCYIVHHYLFTLFIEQRSTFDLRFIFDVYHIILHGINGVLVSDYYIKHNIDKLFTNKFLSYEKLKKEHKKVNKHSKKQKMFFGQTLNFPDLSKKDGGDEFSKTLRDCFKTKNKHIAYSGQLLNDEIQTQREAIKVPALEDQSRSKSINTNDLGLRRIQFNVNSISPSIGQVLSIDSNQLKLQKSKLITHQLEKPDNKDFQVLELMREINQTKEQSKEQKHIKGTRSSIIDRHSLSHPSKEYFQKHPKVDPFFKNMLELNYVLKNSQETLEQLPSSQNVRAFLREQEIMQANAGVASKINNPKQKVIEYLIKKKEEQVNVNEGKNAIVNMQYFGKEGKDKVEGRTEWNSNQTTQYNQTVQENLFSSRSPISINRNLKLSSPQNITKQTSRLTQAISTTLIKDPKKIDIVSSKQQQQSDKQMSDQMHSQQKIQQEQHLEKIFKTANQIKESKPIIYKDNRALYNKQFDGIMQQVSTESKIELIIMNLQIRQNLVNKQLQKKIHKM